jgi:hypothetical protein
MWDGQSLFRCLARGEALGTSQPRHDVAAGSFDVYDCGELLSVLPRGAETKDGM